MPGRIVGVSIDSHGNKAYRLALQTREQHIRREKATSNVCTAQALLAVMASMYGVFHGPLGLKAIAQRIHLKTTKLAAGLEKLGFKIDPNTFFDTITVDVGGLQSVVIKSALNEDINLRAVGKTKIEEYSGQKSANIEFPDIPMIDNVRESEILSHPVFNSYHSETSLMRYIKSLENKDLSLTQSMISLGSCTMKLNAASEMIPLSWSEWNSIHPFVPVDQAKGYHEVISKLETFLSEITGFSATSLQPNSGAQGEYSGLLTIAAYHKARGDSHRNICLIPVSAHGTNPASAQMAGMSVVIVNSAENGDVDIEDFKEKAVKAGDNLAACMITYPSTHGVFEEKITEVCDITHQFGGQVYLDGANLNAMVGISKPGEHWRRRLPLKPA